MGKFKVVVTVLVSLWLASYLVAQILDTEIGDKIALIKISGILVSTESFGFLQGSTMISSLDIVELIEKAEENKNVKAILLEINSPGGTAVASKEIVRAVKKAEKPVVSLIREVGASGAYWVASASDFIVADEVSLTGSIGVVSSFLEFSELFEEYGVTYEDLKVGEYKDIGSPFRKMTEKERKILLDKMNLIQDYFVEDVALNRDLSENEVREIANGLYYLGVEAEALGLVDSLGGKDLAVNKTKELANITEAQLVIFEKKRGLIDVLGKLSSNSFYFMGRGIGSEVGKVDLEKNIGFRV